MIKQLFIADKQQTAVLVTTTNLKMLLLKEGKELVGHLGVIKSDLIALVT